MAAHTAAQEAPIGGLRRREGFPSATPLAQWQSMRLLARPIGGLQGVGLAQCQSTGGAHWSAAAARHNLRNTREGGASPPAAVIEPLGEAPSPAPTCARGWPSSVCAVLMFALP